MLYSEILIPDLDKSIHCFCLHLNLFHRSRVKQYERISEIINSTQSKNSPLIVAGDLNDWNKKSSDLFENKLGMKEAHYNIHGVYAKTFPVVAPMLTLDRIYFSGLEVKDAKVFKDGTWSQMSDHAALFAELNLE